MDSRRLCAFLTAGLLLALAAFVNACGGPSDGEVLRSYKARVVPADNGNEAEEGVVVEDRDVTAQSIENTEAVLDEPDALAVRVAEILGTDPRATSDAMDRVFSTESAGSVGSRAGGHAGERDAGTVSVVAQGLSYQEYGSRLGAILGVDGERAAQAIEEAYGVEWELHESGSGADKKGGAEVPSVQRVELYQAVSAGSEFTGALRLDGSLVCWGNDEAHQAKGQLDVPTEGTYVSVNAGKYGSCAVRDDGRLKCWGRVNGGSKPLKRFSAVDTLGFTTCAIRQNGSLQCWGKNAGDLKKEPRGNFVSLSHGGGYVCAIRDAGTVACWGRHANRGWTVPSGEFQAVSASSFAACGLRDSGALECWGQTDEELLDHPLGPFTSVHLGHQTGCGVRPSGRVECWGGNNTGQTVVPDARFQSVSVGNHHACGITVDQKVECWGKSRYGPAPSRE